MTNLRHLSSITWLAVLVVAAGLVLRLGAIDRQGLWADEVFSLAIATGHSLEHPAAVADPDRGDFVEGAHARPPAAIARYATHERPPAGLGRVVRAVQMSHSNPPLYYALLYAWTRATGTGDVALRMFSLVWALACIPLLWWLAAHLGGRTAVLPTLVLFGSAPVAVRFSIEGRMYSLVWFLALATACLAVRLHARGFTYPTFLTVVVTSAAGLLTHYFFLFAWAGIGAWLFWCPGRLDRRLVMLSAFCTAAVVAPWYVLALANIHAWQPTTQGWLEVMPGAGYRPIAVPFELAANFFATRPNERVVLPSMRYVAIAALLLAALIAALDRRTFTDRRTLLWLWLGAVCLAPIAYDLARGTYVGAVPRLALAGLPAAYVLAGASLGRLPTVPQVAVLIAILLIWTPALWRIATEFGRGHSPLREIARAAEEHAGPSDLILVHSIPSGVVGVARYMEGSAPVGAWVAQLGERRVPEDLQALAAGRRRIVLVRTAFTADGAAPQEEYLREHAVLVRTQTVRRAQVLEFSPARGDTFFEDGAVVHAGVPPLAASDDR